jgi:hypothetical protein
MEEDMFASVEPMPFNDRPYFRRLLDFDDLVKNGDVVLDLPAGSFIEAKRFVLSLGRFGKALGPKELVVAMKAEIRR